MRLLRQRPRHDEPRLQDFRRPLPDEAELRQRDPGLGDLSKRDYLAIVRRAVKEAGNDHVTNLAAALAYYAFLAIPSVLLVAAGVFSLLAGPHAVTTVVDKLHTIIPGQAQSL